MIRKRILIALALCISCIGSVKAAESVIVVYDRDLLQEFTDPLVPGQTSGYIFGDITAIAIQSQGNMVVADSSGTVYLLDYQMNLLSSVDNQGSLTALAVQSDDKVLAANAAGQLRLLESDLSGIITRADNLGSLTVVAVQSDDKVLAANAAGQLRQFDSSLTWIRRVDNLGTLSALGVQSNDYVIAGNAEGTVRHFDNNLTWLAKYENLNPFTGIEVRSDDKIYLSTADATKGVLRLYGSDFSYITKQDFLHPIIDIAAYISDEYRVTNPIPADGATSVSVDLAQLEWTTPDLSFTYDVYFGTEGNMTYQGNYGTATFALSQTLEEETVYEWRIDTVVDGVDVYPGHTWSFSIGQHNAFSPSPFSIRGANYMPCDNPWSGMWTAESAAVWEDDMALAESLHINAVRISLSWVSRLIDDNGIVSSNYLDWFETFLATADAHGIKCIVLFSHWWQSPTGHRPEAAWKAAMRSFVISHVSDDRILMWDLENEPVLVSPPAASQADVDAVSDYLAESQSYIKTLDPDCVTTVGLIGWAHLLPILPDIMQYHEYHSTADFWSEGVEFTADSIRAMLYFGQGRPTFFGEFGWYTQGGTLPETEAQQATRYGLILNAAERYKTLGACNWTLLDFSHPAISEEGRNYGIVRTDGSLKPAGYLLKETYRRWSQSSYCNPWNETWYDHQDNTSGWNSGSVAQVTDPVPNDSSIQIKNTASTGSWCITNSFLVDLDDIDYVVTELSSADSSTEFQVELIIYNPNANVYTIVPRTSTRYLNQWVINLANFDLATSSGNEQVQLKIWIYGDVNHTIGLDYIGLVKDRPQGIWDEGNCTKLWNNGSNAIVQDALRDDSLFEQKITSTSGYIQSDAISTDVSVNKFLTATINSIPSGGYVVVEVQDLASGGQSRAVDSIDTPGSYIIDLDGFPWAVPGSNQTFLIKLWGYGAANSIFVWDRVSVSSVASGVKKCATITIADGDINGDCVVDFVDLAVLVENWLLCGWNLPEYCL